MSESSFHYGCEGGRRRCHGLLNAVYLKNASARTKVAETTATRAFQRVATTSSRADRARTYKDSKFCRQNLHRTHDQSGGSGCAWGHGFDAKGDERVVTTQKGGKKALPTSGNFL